MLVLIPFMILYDLSVTWRLVYALYGLFMSGVLAAAIGFLFGSSERSLQRHRPSRRLCDEGWFLSHTNYVHHRLHPEVKEYQRWYLLGNPMAVNISTVRSGILGEPLAIAPSSVLLSADFYIWSALAWALCLFTLSEQGGEVPMKRTAISVIDMGLRFPKGTLSINTLLARS